MGVHKTNPGLNVHSNTGAILEGEMVSAEERTAIFGKVEEGPGSGTSFHTGTHCRKREQIISFGMLTVGDKTVRENCFPCGLSKGFPPPLRNSQALRAVPTFNYFGYCCVPKLNHPYRADVVMN